MELSLLLHLAFGGAAEGRIPPPAEGSVPCSGAAGESDGGMVRLLTYHHGSQLYFHLLGQSVWEGEHLNKQIL